MAITTKKGDAGETALFSGERIAKDHPRVEAIGDLDELSSILGFAKHEAAGGENRETIEALQNDLMGYMGGLALSPEAYARGEGGNFTLKAEPAEQRLSAWIADLEARYPVTGFVLPGKTRAGAILDIARTVCRRAERHVVALNRTEPVNAAMMKYLNRLSDLIFMLARAEDLGVTDAGRH